VLLNKSVLLCGQVTAYLLRHLYSFGNFVNRVVKFIASKYQSIVPESEDEAGPISTEDEVDGAFISEINTLLTSYIDAMESVKLRLGLHIVMQISARGNLYLQQSSLGNALLDKTPKRCALVISRALNLIYVLSALVHPFMPSTSTSILEQLNAPARTVPLVLGTDILAGHTIGKPTYLFKKIEESAAETWRAQYGGSTAVASEAKVGKPEPPNRKKPVPKCKSKHETPSRKV
jgi:methionyl-tRNA synthetase